MAWSDSMNQSKALSRQPLNECQPCDMVVCGEVIFCAVGFDVAAGEEPFAFARGAMLSGGNRADAYAVLDLEGCQIVWAGLIRQWKVLAL